MSAKLLTHLKYTGLTITNRVDTVNGSLLDLITCKNTIARCFKSHLGVSDSKILLYGAADNFCSENPLSLDFLKWSNQASVQDKQTGLVHDSFKLGHTLRTVHFT